MKIIDSIWFTDPGFALGIFGQVGIVIGEDEVTGERKAYVGIGLGFNERLDEQRVAETGTKLTAEMAQRISDLLNKDQRS